MITGFDTSTRQMIRDVANVMAASITSVGTGLQVIGNGVHQIAEAMKYETDHRDGRRVPAKP